MNYSTLPNLVALAILVAVFWAISRKPTTERLHLWLAGWILVLLHFTAEFLGADQGPWGRVLAAVSLDSLVLAGIAFLISVSHIATTWWRQMLMALTIAAPSLAYTNGAIWDIKSTGYYYCMIAVGVAAPLGLFLRLNEKGKVYASVVLAAGVSAAAAGFWAVAAGQRDLGVIVILTALNLGTAVLYYRHHLRVTAGVLTSVCGFGLWSLVFPVATGFALFLPSVHIESEVWNIPKYLVAVGMILTLLEDQIERSNYLAYHDELTGLPNRRLLEDRLEQALAHAKREGSKVAVLLLDLDHFKEVNDTYGHRVGDMTLQAVVGQLGGRIRASDTLARSGGDEFTVVSVVPDKNGAAALVGALGAALSTPVSVEGFHVRTGLSIGVALYPDDGSNADQLHAAADKAMYVAKRAARNSPPNGNSTLGNVAATRATAPDVSCNRF